MADNEQGYLLLRNPYQGTWAAQLVKYPALDLASGPALKVRGIEPHVGLCTAFSPLPTLAPTILLSVSMILTTLSTLYMWDHAVLAFFRLVYLT